MSRVPADGVDAPARLRVRRRGETSVDRYEVRQVGAEGRESGLLAFAVQERTAFAQQADFLVDGAASGHGDRARVFGYRAMRTRDRAPGFNVTDAAGKLVGWFKKDVGRSLVVPTWQLGAPDSFHAVGRERSRPAAVLRRGWTMLPVVGDLGVPWPLQVDFRGADGSVVLRSTRAWSRRDDLDVSLPAVGGVRVDWRVAAAIVVALDALQRV